MVDTEREFSIYAWRDIMQSSDLPSNAKHLATYILKYMNVGQPVAWPSQKTIMRETSLSNGTINKYYKILNNKEWIIRISGNSNRSTRYVLFLPKDIQSELEFPEEFYQVDEFGFYKVKVETILRLTETRHSTTRSGTVLSSGERSLRQTETNKSFNKQKNKSGNKTTSKPIPGKWETKIPDYINRDAWRKFCEQLKSQDIQLTADLIQQSFEVLRSYCNLEQDRVVQQAIRKGSVRLENI